MVSWWRQLGVQWKLHIFIQAALILFFLVSQQWILNRFESHSIKEVQSRAHETADGLINGLNLLMLTGKISDPANRTLLLKKMSESRNVETLRIVRAPQVNAQYGPGLPEEQPVDDIAKAVLFSLQPSFTRATTPEGKPILRAVIPFIASENFRGTNCLVCHDVKPGSANGAADITIDLTDEMARIDNIRTWLWSGAIVFQVALSILIAWFVNIVLNRNISRPVRELQSAMQRIKQNGDLTMRVPVEGKHPDIDEMADTFNTFVQNLDLATRNLALFAKVVENSEEAMIISDARNDIVSVNRAFSRITGYAPEDVIGKNPRILSSGMHKPEFYKSLWSEIQATGHWQGEIFNKRKNGEVYPEWLSISTAKNALGEVTNYVAIFMDITKRKEAEHRIQYMANYDALTGLANRNLLNDRLSQAIAHGQRHASPLAVMFLDLDNFKVINDSLGHHIGDRLLKGVAERLLSCVREGDTVARQGGDEFIIVLTEMNEARNATTIAEKLLQTLAAPFDFDDQEVFVSVSIGIAFFPHDGDDKESLLKNADSAMYRAKESGRNCYRYYTPEMNESASQRLQIQNGLRYALERNELALHYQPQIDIQTMQIKGVEALLRWNHPLKGLLPPNQFIPVAEESGLIIPIGNWILQTACLDGRMWHDLGHRITVSVNVSGRQFKEADFVSVVEQALEASQLDPQYLELELTESILIEQHESLDRTLVHLKALGIKLALDDFGTGYSSLSYLKHFPIDRIKIDQSFVRDMLTDSEDAAIVDAIISIAHSLKLGVIAEGVEEQGQLNFLQEHHCQEVQGFYFSKPIPGDRLRVYLEESGARAKTGAD